MVEPEEVGDHLNHPESLRGVHWDNNDDEDSVKEEESDDETEHTEEEEVDDDDDISAKLLYTDAELIKRANTAFNNVLPPLDSSRFFHSSVPCMHQSHYKWLAEPKRHLPFSFTRSQLKWRPFQLPWSPYQHPLYQTSNNAYGAVPTRLPLISPAFHGKRPVFSKSYRMVENTHDRRCGMYKNFGFSSALDSSNVYDDPRL